MPKVETEPLKTLTPQQTSEPAAHVVADQERAKAPTELKIQVLRYDATNKDMLGEVLVNGEKFCVSLENPERDQKIEGITAIPEGIYKISKRFSPHLQAWVPWVLDVPNYLYILIHWGNTVHDTHGCLLVGDSVGKLGEDRAILNSKVTWEKLTETIFAYLAKNLPVTIEYTKKPLANA